ncbi:hypothetical protein KFE25_001509 [Diacronema lutheri]|uniref:Uncharacterized protein n=1 Tax=Diacronema lutheri TaxID=2081491 RepID=A0A8J5X893_DIALT|nr:hypothetical protein KFE25_001509 [Diacronema lutheri]
MAEETAPATAEAVDDDAKAEDNATDALLSEKDQAAAKIGAAMRGKSARTSLNEQREAAAKINAVGRGHAERAALRQRQRSATRINTRAKGHLARERHKAKRAARDGMAQLEEEPTAPAHDAGERDGAHNPAGDESAAARRIEAAARGHFDRKAVGKRQAAAGTIGKVAKGRSARSEARERREAAAAEAAEAQAQAEAGRARAEAAKSTPTRAKPSVSLVPVASAPEQTFAKPPIRYRFVGTAREDSRHARSYWQTYTVSVHGVHSSAAKLVITIEVHGQLQNLMSVEPVSSKMSDEDWSEIAAALVGADLASLGAADFGALFLLSQAVLKRTAHRLPRSHSEASKVALDRKD